MRIAITYNNGNFVVASYHHHLHGIKVSVKSRNAAKMAVS